MLNKFWCVMLCVFGFAGIVTGQTAPQLLTRANETLETGDIYDAIETYRLAIRQNPDFLDAYLGLARAFYYLDEYDEALRQVQAAQRLGHDSTDLLNIQGRVLLATGKSQDAATLFKLILKKEPYNVDALMGLAEFSLQKGNEAEALEHYRKSLNYNPHDRRLLLSMALVHEAKGERQKAESFLLRAVDEYSDHPLVQVMAARFYLDRGELAQAEYHARTALSLSPGYAAALEVLGAVYLGQKDDSKAVAVMDQLIQSDPENHHAWYLRGVAALRLGDSAQGMASLERTIDLKPSDEIARIVLEDTVANLLKREDERRTRLAVYHFEQAGQFRKKNMNERAEFHYLRGLYLAPLDSNGRIAYARFLKDAKRRSALVRELETLRRLGIKNDFVDDNYEIYKSLLVDTVPEIWKLDQYMLEHQPLVLRVYYMTRDLKTEHPLCEPALARYFQNIMSQSTKISFSSGTSELDPTVLPQEIGSLAEGFAKARTDKADYHVVLAFMESGVDFSFSAGLYLSRTGKKMEEPRSYRTGNYCVQNAVSTVSSAVHRLLPSRGMILKRQLNQVVVNLGSSDGLKVDSELHVLADGTYVLNSAQPGFIFDRKDLLGSIKIDKVDERIASGILKKEGFYDRINEGDTILLPGESVVSSRDGSLAFPYLYNRIRLIH